MPFCCLVFHMSKLTKHCPRSWHDTTQEPVIQVLCFAESELRNLQTLRGDGPCEFCHLANTS